MEMIREIRVSRSTDGQSVGYAVIGEMKPYEAIEGLCIAAVDLVMKYSKKHLSDEDVADYIRCISMDCLERLEDARHG